MWDIVKIVTLGLSAGVAAIAANWARDLGYEVHALIVMVVSGGLFLWTLRNVGDDKGPTPTGYQDASSAPG